jgi:hypothetical protein
VVLDGETAIVPVVIQDEVSLCRLCKALLAEGIYINPVLRPAAAQNLLRISCTAAHSEAHVERLVSTLEKVADKLGIERSPSWLASRVPGIPFGALLLYAYIWVGKPDYRERRREHSPCRKKNVKSELACSCASLLHAS